MPQYITLESLLRENEVLRDALQEIYGVIWAAYRIRGKVYSDNEPVQAAHKSALEICRNALAKRGDS